MLGENEVINNRETELLRLVEDAKRILASARGEERPAALARYRAILDQFSKLCLEGKVRRDRFPPGVIDW